MAMHRALDRNTPAGSIRDDIAELRHVA